MSAKIEAYNNVIKEGMKNFNEGFENLLFKNNNEVAFLNGFVHKEKSRVLLELECFLSDVKEKLLKMQFKFLIEQLNEKINYFPNKITFEELIKLKTGGNDKFSNIKLKKLQEKILDMFGQKTLEEIKDLKLNEMLLPRVMRWVLRGCNVKLAHMKANFDEETYNKPREENQEGLDQINEIEAFLNNN